MEWSLKGLFSGLKKPQPKVAPFEEAVLPGVLRRRVEIDAAEHAVLDDKSNRLFAALIKAQIGAHANYVNGERRARPDAERVWAHRIINYTDKSGCTNSVSVYAKADEKGCDVIHEQSYKRAIAFAVKPVTPEALLENPQLALDGLRRIGLHEDLQDHVSIDTAASTLLSIGAEKPHALPVVLTVTIADPVIGSRVSADMIIPSDAAYYLRGAQNPDTSFMANATVGERVVFSIEPADRIRRDENLVHLPPSDGLDYTNVGVLNLNHTANRLEIAIPLLSFTGDELTADRGFGFIDAQDFAASPFSGEYRTATWRPLSAVIDEVRAQGSTPAAAPSPTL